MTTNKSLPRIDATNLRGVTSLMNNQFVDKSKDLDEEEEKIMGQSINKRRKEVDPVKIYIQEMESLAEEIGINLPGGTDSKKSDERSFDEPTDSSDRSKVAGYESKLHDRYTSKSSRSQSKKDNGVTSLFGIKEEQDDLFNLDKNAKNKHRDKRGRDNYRSYDSEDRSDDDDRSYYSDDYSDDDRSYYSDEYSDDCGSYHSNDSSRSRRSHGGRSYDSESIYSGGSRRSERKSHNKRSSKFDIDERENEKRQKHRDRDDRERKRHDRHSPPTEDWRMTRDMSGSRGRSNGRDREDRDYNKILRQISDDFNIDVSDLRNKETVPYIKNHSAPYDKRDNNTRQEISKNPLDDVLRELRAETATEYAAEREDVRDRKSRKLEEIAQLKSILHDDGVDVSTIPSVTLEDSEDKIDGVLKILRLKNDRSRYSSLAEEVILGAAECIETVLDGTREIPIVGWKPDYTDYHNTVNVKLHRMRFETSQLINDAIQGWKLSPATRIAIELLPSFFLYPRQRSKQRGTPGLFDELNKTAYNGIRNMDDHKSMADISNI